jgi:hypothetical protein
MCGLLAEGIPAGPDSNDSTDSRLGSEGLEVAFSGDAYSDALVWNDLYVSSLWEEVAGVNGMPVSELVVVEVCGDAYVPDK